MTVSEPPPAVTKPRRDSPARADLAPSQAFRPLWPRAPPNDDLLAACLEKSRQLLDTLQGYIGSSPHQDRAHVVALASRIHDSHQTMLVAGDGTTGKGKSKQTPAIGGAEHDSGTQDKPLGIKRKISQRSDSRSPSPDSDGLVGQAPSRAVKRPRRDLDSNGAIAGRKKELAKNDPIAALPNLPYDSPFARRRFTLAVPNVIFHSYFKQSKAKYAPRYSSPGGHLAVHAYRDRCQVLSHHLLPPRQLGKSEKSRYLTLLKQSPRYHTASEFLIERLLHVGIGISAPQRQLEQLVKATQPRSSPSRVIAQAATRPYILVTTANRASRPDLWDALVAICDNVDERVPPWAKLGLLVGIEIDGFEETAAEVRLPAESKRAYKLCERIAIVAMQCDREGGGEGRVQLNEAAAASESDREDDEADLSSLDELDSESDSDTIYSATKSSIARSNPPRTQPSTSRAPPASQSFHPATPVHAVPTSLIRQLSKSIQPMIKTTPRYAPTSAPHPGQLQVYNLSHSAHVAAHTLAPPRQLTASAASAYLARIRHAIHDKRGPHMDLMSYAVRRGPTDPFPLALALAHIKRGRYCAWDVRTAAVRWVARPVVLVDDQLDKAEYAEDWRALVELANAKWPGTGRDRHAWEAQVEAGRLVMLLGLEVVGFEAPRAADQVPALDACEFVVRERYALVVGNMRQTGSEGTDEGDEEESGLSDSEDDE